MENVENYCSGRSIEKEEKNIINLVSSNENIKYLDKHLNLTSREKWILSWTEFCNQKLPGSDLELSGNLLWRTNWIPSKVENWYFKYIYLATRRNTSYILFNVTNFFWGNFVLVAVGDMEAMDRIYLKNDSKNSVVVINAFDLVYRVKA